MNKKDFYKDAREDLSGPLHGVTVIEATTSWAGPMAGCVLADFGATVIKVEHPAGEVARRLTPMLPGSAHSLPEQTVNRNKQNLSLNLQHPEGKAAFFKLAATADIVVENFRPGTLASWGVGYDGVREVKPDIVYVSISAFGQYGSLSHRVGYDPVAQNFGGWTSLNGEAEGAPTKAPTYLCDDLAGLHGALGAMAALRHRDQTGEGQHVDISLVDSLLFQSNGYLTSGALGLPLERLGNEFSFAVPARVYTCTDGDVFAGVLLDTHWRILAEHLGRSDLAGLMLADRIGQRDELNGILSEYCAHHTVAEVVDTFSELGLPATRVNTYADAADEPHVAERDMLQMVEMTDGISVPLTGPAAKFSRTPVRIRTPAQPLGAQNQQILLGLGYTDDDIEQLREMGAI